MFFAWEKKQIDNCTILKRDYHFKVKVKNTTKFNSDKAEVNLFNKDLIPPTITAQAHISLIKSPSHFGLVNAEGPLNTSIK